MVSYLIESELSCNFGIKTFLPWKIWIIINKTSKSFLSEVIVVWILTKPLDKVFDQPLNTIRKISPLLHRQQCYYVCVFVSSSFLVWLPNDLCVEWFLSHPVFNVFILFLSQMFVSYSQAQGGNGLKKVKMLHNKNLKYDETYNWGLPRGFGDK